MSSSRGWCLFEVATREKAVKNSKKGLAKSVFLADKAKSMGSDYFAKEHNYFRFMKNYDAEDRKFIQDEVLKTFSTAENFNKVVKEASKQAAIEVKDFYRCLVLVSLKIMVVFGQMHIALSVLFCFQCGVSIYLYVFLMDIFTNLKFYVGDDDFRRSTSIFVGLLRFSSVFNGDDLSGCK